VLQEGKKREKKIITPHKYYTRYKNWKDGEEWEVEKIIDHKKQKHGDLMFLVKWKGWSEKHCSWVKQKHMTANKLVTSDVLQVMNEK